MLRGLFCKSTGKIGHHHPTIFPPKIPAILAIVSVSLFLYSLGLTTAGSSGVVNIRRASELSEQDFENLIPTAQGIQYYLNNHKQYKMRDGIKYKTVETSFVTLLPIDYKLIAHFVNKTVMEKGKLKSIDGIMDTLPNLMNYLQTMSSGKITKEISQNGYCKNVSITYTLDKDALTKKYPRTGTILSQGYITDVGFILLDEERYPLVDVKIKGAYIIIQFSIDNNGYIVSSQNSRPKKTQKTMSTPSEIFFYLDSNFTAEATLMKIFRLCSVKVDKIRFLFNLDYSPEAVTLLWKTVDVEVGNVTVRGFNAEAIKKSLSAMKGTFQGGVVFEPAAYRGESLTFMRVAAHSERIDEWLTEIAILTWEHIGLSALNELRAPIGEGLSAFREDLVTNFATR